MSRQHDGTNARDPAQQHVSDIQRQREQYRIANPAVSITHAFYGRHHRRVGIRNRTINAVNF
ncbi:hypothetical protein D3C76_1561790 [compost metagenome]